MSLAQSAELAHFFDALASSWETIGNAGRARDATRAGLDLARARGLIEFAERFEGRLEKLGGASVSGASGDGG